MKSVHLPSPWPGRALLIVACLALAGCGGGPDPNLDLGGIDMGEVLDGLIARTRHAVAGINGLDSARVADGDLQRINQDFDDFLYHLPKVNEEGREVLARKASRALPELQAVANQIYEMPALDEIIGHSLRTTVNNLALVR